MTCRWFYCNDEYARWFSTTPDLMVGRTLVDLYGAADSVRFMPFVERVLAGERMEYQRLLHNPLRRRGMAHHLPDTGGNAHGEIAGFITCAIDVHELQVTMSAPRVANQRLSSHMDNSPLAVLEMDHEFALAALLGSRQASSWAGSEPIAPWAISAGFVADAGCSPEPGLAAPATRT